MNAFRPLVAQMVPYLIKHYDNSSLRLLLCFWVHNFTARPV